MKHYLSPEGEIFAYEEDGSQDHLIPDGFRLLGAGELAALREQLPRTDEEMAQELRVWRDAELAASDWTQGRDVPEEFSQLWAPYRQALRALPEQPGFPRDVSLPVRPAG